MLLETLDGHSERERETNRPWFVLSCPKSYNLTPQLADASNPALLLEDGVRVCIRGPEVDLLLS